MYLENILKPLHNILKIKYFTARRSARPNNPTKPQRQDVYLRAVQAYCKEVEIYFGHFPTNRIRALLAHLRNGRKVVEVIKTEEKGSDVNLAVHLITTDGSMSMTVRWLAQITAIYQRLCV